MPHVEVAQHKSALHSNKGVHRILLAGAIKSSIECKCAEVEEEKHAFFNCNCFKKRKGEGYVAVPACGGSLAEAKGASNQTNCFK
eukprot:635804-Pelagomonas_calceolata.AAC.2